MTMKFYCDESLKKDDKGKADELLSYAFGLADHVEFNILYKDERELEMKIKSIKVLLLPTMVSCQCPQTIG